MNTLYENGKPLEANSVFLSVPLAEGGGGVIVRGHICIRG